MEKEERRVLGFKNWDSNTQWASTHRAALFFAFCFLALKQQVEIDSSSRRKGFSPPDCDGTTSLKKNKKPLRKLNAESNAESKAAPQVQVLLSEGLRRQHLFSPWENTGACNVYIKRIIWQLWDVWNLRNQASDKRFMSTLCHTAKCHSVKKLIFKKLNYNLCLFARW